VCVRSAIWACPILSSVVSSVQLYFFHFLMGSHSAHIVPCICYWPDGGCFTAETCSPDVIDISSMRWYTYVVF